MHPTPTEELAGVRRLVTSLVDQPGLAADVVDDLVTAGRVLRRLERSVLRVQPWLAADNAANAALLAELAPELTDLGVEVQAALDSPTDSSNPEAVEARNEQLRDLLARVVVASSRHHRGEEIRRRIADRLAASLEDRPW